MKTEILVPRLALAAGLLLVLNAARPPARAPRDGAEFTALPVLDHGRVKPLDTVARASLLTLSGKQTVRGEGGRRLTAGAWLTEVLFAPERADREKVFRVDDPEVLALFGKRPEDGRAYSFADIAPAMDAVRGQAQAAADQDSSKRDRFQSAVLRLEESLALYQGLKNTVQVEDARGLGAELAAFDASRANGRLMTFVERYRFLQQAAAFRPLPPRAGADAKDYESVGGSLLDELQGAPRHPLLGGLAVLSDAYRADDPAVFDAAAREYAAVVRARVPSAAARARLEVLFNRAEPFYLGIVLYTGVLLLSFASWLTWPDALRRSSYSLLAIALVLHSAGLAARMWLEGRPPVTNLYSSAVFIGWFAALLAAYLEKRSRKGFGALAAAVLGGATLIVAHNLTGNGDTMEMMRAVLDSNFWLATHVITVTIGYSATFLAGLLAAVYILRGALTRSLDAETAKALQSAVYGTVCFGLFFSFLGTVLGGIWADQSWGRFWGWDPKENGALMIVLWNSIILHARWAGRIRERGLMVMAVFGNVITAFSWFGVNMLGIGLHSYGFMEGAFRALAAFTASQLAVMAVGAVHPSRWRSAARLAA